LLTPYSSASFGAKASGFILQRLALLFLPLRERKKGEPLENEAE
jgi:hypothetical protein